jgi:hypothetical protein
VFHERASSIPTPVDYWPNRVKMLAYLAQVLLL